MTRCPGGECPQKENCACHDEFLTPSRNDVVEFPTPPFDPTTGRCDYIFPNGNDISDP